MNTASTALPGDVDRIDSVIHAMYEVISGPAGEVRDWDRLRSLYYPGAHLVPIVSTAGQPARARMLSAEEYIHRVEPIFAKESFWERETRRECTVLGRVAHILSYYESFHDPDGTPFESGVNSIQLFYDDSRWWVLSVVWNTSRSG